MSSGAFTLADVDKPSKGRFSSADIGSSDLGEGTVSSNKLEHAVGRALQGAGLPTSVANIPDWFKHLTGSAKDSEPWWSPVSKAVKEPTQENIVGAVPFIGPMSVSMAKDAKEGNYMDASATMMGALSLLKMAGQVKPGTTAMKSQIADAHDSIQSVLKQTSGHSLTASMLQQLLPEAQETKFYGNTEIAAGNATASELESKMKDVETARQKELAANERLKNLDAQSKMTRQRQQDLLDTKAAKNAPQPSPFGNATPTNVSIGNLKLPEPGGTTSSTGTVLQGNPTPFVSKFTSPEPSKIVSPLSPAPPINKTLVSYDREILVHMARGGDLNALRELIRNPGGIDVPNAVPNSKFLMEENRPTEIYGGPKK